MKLNFEELFPILRYDNQDEYRDHCRFLFEDDPSNCIAYIDEKMNVLLKENIFALDACRKEERITKECCKKYSGTNDLAYTLCMEAQPSLMSSWSLWIIVTIVFMVIGSVWLFIKIS